MFNSCIMNITNRPTGSDIFRIIFIFIAILNADILKIQNVRKGNNYSNQFFNYVTRNYHNAKLKLS